MKTLLEGEWALSEFAYLAENCWCFTEKVDGTNCRVIWDRVSQNFMLQGKTNRAQLHPLLKDAIYTLFDPTLDWFKENFEDMSVCLYGEGYGPKIQNGGKYRTDQGFVLFDVFINGAWLERKNVVDIARHLKLKVVPEIGRGTLFDMVELVQDGFNSTWGDFQAEGVVARPEVELCTRRGKRVITKLKCKDFKR